MFTQKKSLLAWKQHFQVTERNGPIKFDSGGASSLTSGGQGTVDWGSNRALPRIPSIAHCCACPFATLARYPIYLSAAPKTNVLLVIIVNGGDSQPYLIRIHLRRVIGHGARLNRLTIHRVISIHALRFHH